MSNKRQADSTADGALRGREGETARLSWHAPKFEELDIKTTEVMCGGMTDAHPGSES
jgi:hypothetical protein